MFCCALGCFGMFWWAFDVLNGFGMFWMALCVSGCFGGIWQCLERIVRYKK